MVRLILYRCIRISAHVSELQVAVPAPLCLKMVAAWSLSTNWNTRSGDNVTYHEIDLPGHTPKIQTLYYAMKNVSSSVVQYAICHSLVI